MNEVAGEFNGFPTYHDVRDPIIRAWNRINTIFNMKEILRNNAMSVAYMKKFNRADQLAIGMLAIKIKKNGFENTRREIMRKNNAS